MVKAVITGDVIDSTKLSSIESENLISGLKSIIDEIEVDEDIRAELYRGDSLQCVIKQPKKALKTALLIKMYVKGIISKNGYLTENKVDKFVNKSSYDIRLAIGIGKIEQESERITISQGEAFNLSGRLLDEMKNKQTIAIRTSDRLNEEFETAAKLLDFILSNATQNQCEVIYYKLKGLTEKEIAEIVGVNQSSINQRSNSSGWNAINQLIHHFENQYA